MTTEKRDPMLDHSCEVVATAPNRSPGRSMWLGKLTEQIPGHLEETHCLHITTPYKSVVFGIMEGDTQAWAIFATVVNGGKAINPVWLERQAKFFEMRAIGKLGGTR